jgi:hypothetical protein
MPNRRTVTIPHLWLNTSHPIPELFLPGCRAFELALPESTKFLVEQFPSDPSAIGALWRLVCQHRYLRTLFQEGAVCRPDLFTSTTVLDSDTLLARLNKDSALTAALASTDLVSAFYNDPGSRLAVAAAAITKLIDRSASYV